MTLLKRLLLLVSIALAPSLVMQTYNQVRLYRQGLASVEHDILQKAVQVAIEQDQLTEAAHQLLGAIASLEAVQQQDTEACNQKLAALVRQYPNYVLFGVVDRNGVRFCSSATPFPGRASLAARAFYKQALQAHGIAVGAYRLRLVDKTPVLEFGSPYFDGHGALEGVVYTGLSLTRLATILSAQPLPPTGEIIVADRNGVVIGSRPDTSWIGRKLPGPHLDLLHSREIDTAYLPGLDGAERLFGYVPVAAPNGDGIYVAYGIDKRAAFVNNRWAIGRGVSALVAGILLALLMTLWVGRRFIHEPVDALVGVCERWRDGDWTVRAPTSGVYGEFEEIAHGFNRLADAVQRELARREAAETQLANSHAEVVRQSRALAARTEIVGQLATMVQRLQSCTTDGEIADTVRRFAPQILPGRPGALCVLNNSRNLLQVIATWNEPAAVTADFAPDECWGLRRGQLHSVTDPEREVVCAHLNSAAVTAYSCRPLIAHGETLGLLYLEAAAAGLAAQNPEANHDLEVLAENVSLALGNQRLHEKLRRQSIRDPLTGLFNRRYLEETLELDLARANRAGSPVSLIMGDVDHFKQFNDRFGHDAGDLVLRRVAELMQAKIRSGDVVCRYGGEEFLILLPGAELRHARDRAELLRQAIGGMEMAFRGQILDSVTISFGVASFPVDARDASALITAADASMYAAKHGGRNRVEVAARHRPEAAA